MALTAAVQTILRRAKIPGCSIAVIEKSGGEYHAAWGMADIRRRIEATEATVYPLFSGTKLFTAAAVVQLEERGMLKLSDPVGLHIPEAAGASGVSLLHLLSHRSGLRDTMRGFLAVSFLPDAPPRSAAALERYRIRGVRPPGERVEYRNVNYALLGEVISRVSGLEYREYVSRHVLTPLGMDASFLRPATSVALGYMQRWDPMRLVIRLLMPATAAKMYDGRIEGLLELKPYELDSAAVGGLVGSMPEFAKFLHSQLNGGNGVLSPEATSKMQALVAHGAAGIESRYGVGLGWKIGTVNGRTFLNHEGGGAGYTTELRIYPDADIGIALGMNLMRMPRTMRAAHQICEMVLEARDDLLR